MRSFYSLSLRFLIRRPGKTFGSIMGIALGVAVIVAAVSAGEAARAQLNRSLRAMLGSADLVVSHARPFDTERVEQALKSLPVEATAKQLFYPARLKTNPKAGAGQLITISVYGLDEEETRRFWPIKTASGKFDLSGKNVVLSRPLARQLNLRIGDELELLTGAGRVRKRLAGILAEVGLGNQGVPAVFMDLKTARADRRMGDKLSYLFVKLKPGAKIATVKKSLARRLGPDLTVGRTPATSAYSLNMIDLLRRVLFALGLFALIVGTLLIYQSTNAAAAQMMPTLALIKALGATKRQLIKVFLLQSVVVGFLASTAGAGIGFWLASTVAVLLASVLGAGGQRLLPSPALIIMAIALGVGVAATATFLPVLKFVRVSVAQALRPRTSAERLDPGRLFGRLARRFDPIFERFSPGAILIQRNLANNFGRVRFTSVCLIAGLAMTIGGQMGVNAFRETANQYLGGVYQRQSFIVRTVEMPGGDTTARMPLETARQLQRIAGVKEVFPYFFAGGARFRGRAVTIQSAGRREIDDWVYVKGEPALAAARVGSGGWVAVSTSFANRNNVGLGDAIDLEAGGYKRRFRVAAVVVGIRESVCVSWPELRKYFHITDADEFEVIPAAGADYKALGARLDRFAQEKGYFVFTSKQFREQMDAYLNGFAAVLLAITGSVLILTALALANMTVVGALERRRQLGVLRGQGMTRRQLAAMLVSENIAVGLLSLPAGLALGYIVGSLFRQFIREESGMTLSGTGGLWVFRAGALIMLAVLYVTAIFPARRVASTPVAEALRYE